MALSRRTGQRFQASIWPGFVDAMTGLLLVLFFVLSIFMVVQFVLRETISGQESELDVLAGEIAALAQALGLSENRNTSLEARVGELSATLDSSQSRVSALTAELNASQRAVDDLSTRLTEAQTQIAGLTGERDAATFALSAAETRLTAFEAQVAALIAERDGALGRIEALEGREADLMSEAEALNLALAQARSEVDASAEAARLAAARREALDALVADLRRRNAEQAEATEALTADLTAAQDALSEEEAARLAESAAAEALRARLQEADTELTAMTLALEEQRKKAEDTLTLLAAAQSVEADLDGQLAAALLQIESLQQDNQALGETAREVGQLRATSAELEARVAAALQRADSAETAARQNTAELREQLAEALAARLAAEALAEDRLSAADRQQALLSAARNALAQEEEAASEAQKQAALLNQQVAALRAQLGDVQALLDDARERDAAKDVQLQSLGSELNTALARVAAEERRRRVLEEAERKRLEDEKARLAAEAQDLARYRSEFFGQLRDLLGTQEGVRIVGDRFVFSSEVLFDLGQAELSAEGQGEIAKVAEILQQVSGDIPPQIDWVLQVDGHTDNVPLLGTGAFRDNWELSQARALSVVRYMVDVLGLPPDRLSANGFGEFQPVNPADTPAARAQNRRIEIKFTEK